MTIHDRDGRRRRAVALPEIGSVAGITGEWDGDEAFFGFSSYTSPPAVYRIPLPGGEEEEWARTEAGEDTARYRTRLMRYASRDGTLVSMFLVDRKDRPADGTGPAVLTGYGGISSPRANGSCAKVTRRAAAWRSSAEATAGSSSAPPSSSGPGSSAPRSQAATSSGPPVLLRVETRAGHGQGKPLAKVIEEWTDVWSFLFTELAMEP